MPYVSSATVTGQLDNIYTKFLVNRSNCLNVEMGETDRHFKQHSEICINSVSKESRLKIA
jgi:hypothetical protein